ncbi:Gldg family protein [Chitinophaga ginsengisegetis]|uniref:Gldg family protein n=1 Tax=Chitinophaga ginsengisegetis TaxID=393003 RepID=UPI0034346995
MKLLFRIAKNEFRYLFYSPIAWFLIIVFLVQCALVYTSPVYDLALYQDMVLKNNPRPTISMAADSLTLKVFLAGGIFLRAIGNLYLFIPLLTMGLISREINNGTIKLLYSSPVQLRQIVLGKYLGIMFYSLLLIAIIGIFMITGFFNIKNADYGVLFSAALGFYLIVCAYSAIGLFMSSLSTYQIVSALASFTVIFILSRIGGLWQKYDFVRDLTYFLSLQNRTGKMLQGLITTKDVIYFIVVSWMFVGFTLIKLRNGREVKPWYIKAGRFAGVFAVTLMTGYITSRPAITGYWDTSATKMNTIHPRTQQLLKEMGDTTLEVTLYTNLVDRLVAHGLPEVRNVSYLGNFWEAYLRFKPNISFKYEYYYDTDAKGTDSALYKMLPGKNLKQIAAEYADAMDLDLSMFKTPEEMRKLIDLKPEGYRLIMQLKYKGRTEYLRTFEDDFVWADEQNMNAALKHLLYGDIPKLLFVSGELERNIYKMGEREYAYHTTSKPARHALINVGFDVDTINLTTQNIPAGITALVLADPKMDLSPAVYEKLKNYIDAGGNMLITGEPGKQYVLNPLLQQIGVQLMNGQLVQPTYNETPDKVKPYLTATSAGLAEEPAMLVLRERLQAHLTGDSIKILMPGVAGISYTRDSAFTVAPLAMTSPDRVWLKAGNLVTDSTLPPFNPLEGDIKQASFPTVVQLTRSVRGKEQRIIVCGDADFLSNRRLAESFFGNALHSWLNYNQFPVYTPRPQPEDTRLQVNAEVAGLQKIIYIWVLPGVILLIGIILLIRRKRK